MQTAKKSILVVDDEQGYRDLYVFFLEPLGFEVTCVTNGLEAVRKTDEKKYDLVLMDVHMPVMTGPEALRRIRQTHPDQKFVVFSSSSDQEFKGEHEVIRQGALSCLYKPVDIDELRRILVETVGLAVEGT